MKKKREEGTKQRIEWTGENKAERVTYLLLEVYLEYILFKSFLDNDKYVTM